MSDTATCWYQQSCVDEMNRFFDKSINNSIFQHLAVFTSLLELTEERGSKLLDLGCGSGMISVFCRNYDYYGADLPHILAGCAMRNYPKYQYRACDIVNDDLSWVGEYPIVVLNAVIDIMEHPLEILGKIMMASPKIIIVHRQEITEKGMTRVIRNDSYGGYTYHSIINKKEFERLCDEHEYYIHRDPKLTFGNWENGGNSFLLKKKLTWALGGMDRKLKKYLNFDNGIFLEAGANDGIRQSNTMYFEYYRNWKGILVEPIPEVFEDLKRNRSNANVFVNAALVDKAWKYPEVDMYHSTTSHGLMSGPERRDTSDKFVSVKAITLNHIISSNPGFQHIHLMVLDMEGAEVNALHGIEFDRWKIDFILTEERDDDGKIAALLAPWYDRIDKLSDHDYLYKRK